MVEAEKQLEREIEELLKLAERTYAAEDAKFGKGQSGDDLPKELQRRESRRAKIREAKAQLEAEAKVEAEARKREAEEKLAEREREEEKKGRRPGGRPPAVPDPDKAVPRPQAQKNSTDPTTGVLQRSPRPCFGSLLLFPVGFSFREVVRGLLGGGGDGLENRFVPAGVGVHR